MAGSRSEILGKIRLALNKPRRKHHHGHHSAPSNIQELFASVSSRDLLLEKFKKEFEYVSGEFSHCADEGDVRHVIKQLIVSSQATKVAVSAHSICKRLKIEETLHGDLPGVRFLKEDIDSENSFDRVRLRDDLAGAELSITGAEFLLAESGTIVVAAGSQASRQISLLPSIHLVLATVNQIYPNMADLFLDLQKKYGDNLPGSALTFITGPSRTADIEKVLIKGVHGPMRLIVLVLGN